VTGEYRTACSQRQAGGSAFSPQPARPARVFQAKHRRVEPGGGKGRQTEPERFDTLSGVISPGHGVYGVHMKVVCDRSALLDVINHVTSVVPPRSTSPVLQCVRMTAEPGLLTLQATDMEVGLRISIDQVDVAEPGEVLVPADKVAQIVRSSSDPSLTLERIDHALHIRGADSHFTMYGFDPAGEGRPAIGDDEGAVDCEIPGGILATLVQRTLFAGSSENLRFAIRGALFDRQEKVLRLVATDGKRLAIARGMCIKGTGTARCIIPSKPLNLLTRLIHDPDDVVRVVIGENRIMFMIGKSPTQAILQSNLVEGTFPPFEDVIPKDLDKKIVSNVELLSSAIKRAALLTDVESKGVRMRFADNRLTLRSRASEMGEAEINVDLQYDGEPIEVGFSPGHITDALKVIESQDVIIELKSQTKPAIFRSGTDFTYVVLPLQR